MPESTLDDPRSIVRRADGEVPDTASPQTSERLDAQASRRQRVRTTVYPEPDDVAAIGRMQTDEWLLTGRKPERSDVMSRATRRLSASVPT